MWSNNVIFVGFWNELRMVSSSVLAVDLWFVARGVGRSAPLGAVANISPPIPWWSTDCGPWTQVNKVSRYFWWPYLGGSRRTFQSPRVLYRLIVLDPFLVDIFCARFDPIRDTTCGFPSWGSRLFQIRSLRESCSCGVTLCNFMFQWWFPLIPRLKSSFEANVIWKRE